MTVLRRLPVVAVLVVLWLLLMGEASAGNVLAGVAVGIGAIVAFPLEATSPRHRVHPVATVSLFVHFMWLVLASNIQMVLTVLRPRPDRLRAGIVRVELAPTTSLVTTLVANALTLTPGSLTVTADDDGVLFVHLMSFVSPEATRSDVADLHRRVIAAFEPVAEPTPGGRP